MHSMETILIVDDHRGTTEAISQIVEEKKLRAITAENAEAAFEIFKSSAIDLIITDMKLPEKSGLELLDQVRAIDPEIPVIVITAFGTIQNAVEAMKSGALDYITKPFSAEEIDIKIDKAIKAKKLARENCLLNLENSYLREEIQHDFSEIVGQSPLMLEVFDLVKKVAPAQSPVLILGESGTGKELIARAIHQNSQRKNSPFVKVNCAALAEGVLESELFGHEKGAFTSAHRRKPGRFEIAADGTIFLDEVSEISPSVQVKLLRVLQEREFERVGGTETLQMKARLITATNQNLTGLVEQREFREDLFYRLNVVSIQLPSLRERSEDIPLLAQHFIEKYNQDSGKNIKGITPRAVKLLLNYSWKGNIRELENTIERAIVLTSNQQIDVDDLPSNLVDKAFYKDNSLPEEGDDLSRSLDDQERKLIFKALIETRGNITKAAQRLGIKRTTLRYKMGKYDLLRYDFR